MRTSANLLTWLAVSLLTTSAWAQTSSISVGSGQGVAGETGIVVPVNLSANGDNIAGIDMTVTFTTASQYAALTVDCGVQTVSANVFSSCSESGNVVTIQIDETAGNAWVTGLLANITVDVDASAVVLDDPLVATVIGALTNGGQDLNPRPTTTNGTFSVTGPPNLTLGTSSPLVFADTQVSQTSLQTSVLVLNDGAGPLEITNISEAASPGCDQFTSIFPATPLTLEVAAFDFMLFTFAPTSRGEHSCEVTLESNDPDGDTTFILMGSGVGSELTVTPSSLDFPDTHVGDSNGPMQFTISNTGDPGYNLTVTGINIPDQDNDEDYLVEGFLAGAIAPGDNEIVDVTFQPQSGGDQNATLQINSNANVNPNGEVHLMGRGTERLIVLSPATVHFGDVYVGYSKTSNASIANTGEATLSVSDLSLSGVDVAEFAITDPIILPTPGNPIEIAGNSSSTVTIECAPISLGTKTASLDVISDADNSPLISATLICTALDASDLITIDGFE